VIGVTLDSETEKTTDLIQPFQLELANVRGRAARLGRTLDDVLGLHDYPLQVEQIVAEAMVSAVLLASLLKYEGIFTLQAKGDGPVSLLVVDVTSAGDVRAYARFDADRLHATPASFGALMGEGYLAFTVDQGPDTESYQGIVALTDPGLADCLRHYFDQSEQLLTTLKMVARHTQYGWRAGAILVQRLPDDDAGRLVKSAAEDEEDWRRATILLNTAADVELLDRSLPLTDLLFRLFHEERVRVFSPGAIQRGCRCSEDRVRRVLAAIPPEEIEELRVEGEIAVTCEFCGTIYSTRDIPDLAG
jgi:molecular chaperone Hsp33